jgi:hypothetical protein
MPQEPVRSSAPFHALRAPVSERHRS